MLHLLLIGGGEIGAPKTDGTLRPLETLKIDKHFVASLSKHNPKILFIPTATEELDPTRTYEQGMRALYGDKLGCEVEALYLSDNPSLEYMQQKLLDADAVYVGGGNTPFLIKRWRETGFDALIKQTALSGKPIAGLSAGAICWFNKFLAKENDVWKFAEGLGILADFCIPHWDKRKDLAKEPIVQDTQFLGIEECAALEIVGSTIKVIRSKESANVYRCKYTRNLEEIKIDNATTHLPMTNKVFD